MKGPSITPRPPQGQPIVAALGHAPVAVPAHRRGADVGFVTPPTPRDAAAIVDEIRAEQARRPGRRPVHVFADLVVFLDDEPRPPRPSARRGWTSSRAAPTPATRPSSPARPAQLADLLAGLAAGRPVRLPAAARRHAATTSRRSPGGWSRNSSARGAVPHRVRGRHAARACSACGRPANRYAAATERTRRP